LTVTALGIDPGQYQSAEPVAPPVVAPPDEGPSLADQGTVVG
jgi:hypothetical protein